MSWCHLESCELEKLFTNVELFHLQILCKEPTAVLHCGIGYDAIKLRFFDRFNNSCLYYFWTDDLYDLILITMEQESRTGKLICCFRRVSWLASTFIKAMKFPRFPSTWNNCFWPLKTTPNYSFCNAFDDILISFDICSYSNVIRCHYRMFWMFSTLYYSSSIFHWI